LWMPKAELLAPTHPPLAAGAGVVRQFVHDDLREHEPIDVRRHPDQRPRAVDGGVPARVPARRRELHHEPPALVAEHLLTRAHDERAQILGAVLRPILDLQRRPHRTPPSAIARARARSSFWRSYSASAAVITSSSARIAGATSASAVPGRTVTFRMASIVNAPRRARLTSAPAVLLFSITHLPARSRATRSRQSRSRRRRGCSRTNAVRSARRCAR